MAFYVAKLADGTVGVERKQPGWVEAERKAADEAAKKAAKAAAHSGDGTSNS